MALTYWEKCGEILQEAERADLCCHTGGESEAGSACCELPVLTSHWLKFKLGTCSVPVTFPAAVLGCRGKLREEICCTLGSIFLGV